ncbi:23S rRNA (uracil1939-C5)-methyltransferase [Neorhizobium galegae]|uniref:class I SAM-dependent RNA methyltransferase n=1 Tax=Neorhizobium galegae TaxID=399 RepID=UPI001AE44F50|nr:class I SAM-dependent RNA methyltransferase [Neorhizobium galegae]MBP2547793.1 23S rRNA (uracil1939-C5)-methyltransferase [Neorhizobium galegae]
MSAPGSGTQTVTIARLGAQGHGIAHGEDGPIYVPFALPGETVSIARVGAHGTVMSTATASPDRVAPVCRHFGPDSDACGGCSLQHLADVPYQAFKRQLVVDALKSKGLTPEVRDLVTAAPGERRRVVFSARMTEKGLLLGFNRGESHQLFSVVECPITTAGIVGRLDVIRRAAGALAQGTDVFRLTVLETRTGLDLSAEGLKALTDAQRRRATETVLALKGVVRLSVNGEILIEKEKPLLDFASVPVSPPPGGFTQATRQAEDAMAAIVIGHLGKAKRVADLFAGSGTFALRIAAKARVHAVESDAKAIAALDHAARHAQGLKPVSIERRDLYRRPMMAQELKVFDAVVFDPPRAGAEVQMSELVRSGVKKVVAVSCNPLTLSRDLAILIAGGYRITSVTPVDQFLWNPHVEAVALLEK